MCSRQTNPTLTLTREQAVGSQPMRAHCPHGLPALTKHYHRFNKELPPPFARGARSQQRLNFPALKKSQCAWEARSPASGKSRCSLLSAFLNSASNTSCVYVCVCVCVCARARSRARVCLCAV